MAAHGSRRTSEHNEVNSAGGSAAFLCTVRRSGLPAIATVAASLAIPRATNHERQYVENTHDTTGGFTDSGRDGQIARPGQQGQLRRYGPVGRGQERRSSESRKVTTVATHKQRQVPLVSDHGPAQPPLPGGWALAVFGAIETFAPGFANEHRVDISRGTKTNINRGDTIKQSTYDDQIEKKLVEIATALFPRTAATSRSMADFVNEFFRLWTFSADAGATWAKIQGFTPAQSATLSRALVRDLMLRLCYLECCERKLQGEDFSEWELALSRKRSFPRIYRGLLEAEMQRRRWTQIGMGRKLKVDSRRLRGFMSGEAAPSFAMLCALRPSDECRRLLAGLGFCDALLRKLHLNDTALAQEILNVAKSFLPIHRGVLETFSGEILHAQNDGSILSEPRDLKGYLAYGQHILIFPGFEELIQRRVARTALWRCHLYALRFARMMDLAQAYYRFSDEAGEEALEEFLRNAERESGDCPYRWMENLRETNPVVAFPDGNGSG